jgi:archaellum component FlaC
MIMSFEGYQEALQEQQEKDKDLQSIKERMIKIENVLVSIQPLLQNVKPEMLSKLTSFLLWVTCNNLLV